MRSAFLLVCVIALSVVVNGQSRTLGSTSDGYLRFESAVMSSGTVASQGGGSRDSRRITMRGVELHLGNSILLADEVEMPAGGGVVGQEEFQLRGNVRLRTSLDHSGLDALLSSLIDSSRQ